MPLRKVNFGGVVPSVSELSSMPIGSRFSYGISGEKCNTRVKVFQENAEPGYETRWALVEPQVWPAIEADAPAALTDLGLHWLLSRTERSLVRFMEVDAFGQPLVHPAPLTGQDVASEIVRMLAGQHPTQDFPPLEVVIPDDIVPGGEYGVVRVTRVGAAGGGGVQLHLGELPPKAMTVGDFRLATLGAAADAPLRVYDERGAFIVTHVAEVDSSNDDTIEIYLTKEP